MKVIVLWWRLNDDTAAKIAQIASYSTQTCAAYTETSNGRAGGQYANLIGACKGDYIAIWMAMT